MKIKPDAYAVSLILVLAAFLAAMGTGEIVKMRQKPVKVEVIADTAAETLPAETLPAAETSSEIVEEISAQTVETVFIDLTADGYEADTEPVVIDRSMPGITSETENSRPAETKAQTAQSVRTKVNINTASKEELMSLPGIGEKTADAIIAYREIAPFETPEEIMEVKGIGEKKYDAVKDDICV